MHYWVDRVPNDNEKCIVFTHGLTANHQMFEKQVVKFLFPVTILLGQHDKTGKVKQYCNEWSRQEGYPLKIIAGAAHFANADNPEDVNQEIKHFLNDTAL